MTNQQINEVIAEACGWKKEDGVYMWTTNGIDCTSPELWDWCNDLNAMHKAEDHLMGKQFMTYFLILDSEGSLWGVRAPARQRAEAFLRTLGKWEEAE